MKISVKVKTRAKKEGVEELIPGEFIVSVKTAPEKGKANKRVIKFLAEHFKIAKSDIEIISGLTSKRKTISVVIPAKAGIQIN